MQSEEPLVPPLELFRELLLLLVRRLVALAGYQFEIGGLCRAADAALLEILQPLQQRLVLALQAVHSGLAEVLPLLRGVVAKGEHTDAGREVAPCTDLTLELEECLLELLDSLELFLALCLGF